MKGQSGQKQIKVARLKMMRLYLNKEFTSCYKQVPDDYITGLFSANPLAHH